MRNDTSEVVIMDELKEITRHIETLERMMAPSKSKTGVRVTAQPEEPGGMPSYLTGDIVFTKEEAVGVIVEAKHDDCRVPYYSLDEIPGCKPLHKDAWWEASEWSEVLLGPLHDFIDRAGA